MYDKDETYKCYLRYLDGESDISTLIEHFLSLVDSEVDRKFSSSSMCEFDKDDMKMQSIEAIYRHIEKNFDKGKVFSISRGESTPGSMNKYAVKIVHSSCCSFIEENEPIYSKDFIEEYKTIKDDDAYMFDIYNAEFEKPVDIDSFKDNLMDIASERIKECLRIDIPIEVVRYFIYMRMKHSEFTNKSLKVLFDRENSDFEFRLLDILYKSFIFEYSDQLIF